MDRFEAAAALEEIAALLRLKGGQAHRARAWERAARSIQSVSEDLDRLVDEGRLRDLPGIGESTGRNIEQLVRDGRSAYLERLREDIPPGVLALSRVVTPNRARLLHEGLGLESVAELRRAAEERRVRELKGFGAKTEQKILDDIARWESRANRAILSDATEDAELLAEYVGEGEGVERVDVAGGVRRGLEVVDAVVLVASGPDPDAIARRFRSYPRLVQSEREDGRVMGKLPDGLTAELLAVSPAAHGRALLEATGPEAHVARLREQAGGALPEEATEEAVYERVGVAYVAPELREDGSEVDRALSGELPEALIEEAQIRGMIHCHTVWSDGRHTIEEMAREADERGLEYLTITDHSPAAFYANGLEVDRLRQQWDEIDRVQEQVRVRLLKGTESDILADGSLDYPDAILERLDVIIASIHGRMRMDAGEMTARLERCMRLPVFKIWGHALGRILLRRDPVKCDLPRILDTIAESRAAIEINGDPHRLDLAPEHARAARERGIRFVVSTDAHSRRGMGYLRWGVTMARRAGLEPGDILNTLDAERFRETVRP